MYLLHEYLEGSGADDLRSQVQVGPTRRPCLVHSWFHGFPKPDNVVGEENRWKLNAWRDAVSASIGCTFSTTIETELEALQRYHEHRLELLHRYDAGWGVLVEQEGLVQRSLERLEAEAPGLKWLVVATEYDGLNPCKKLEWPHIVSTIAELGFSHFDVFGCNNGGAEACVPSVTRFLTESGLFVEARIDASACFEWQGHAV